MKSKDRTTSRPGRFASDEQADSLLADILSETEDLANEEQEERQRAIEARRQADERARAEANAARLAERHAKLEAELERQRALAEKRTLKMKALRANPAADSQPDEPHETFVDADSIRHQIEEELRREFRDIANTPMPEPAPQAARRALTPAWAMAAAIVIASSIGAVAFVSQGYKPDANAYAKSVFAPADRSVVAMEVGYIPIPKVVPTPKEDVIAARPAPRKRRPTPKEVKQPRPASPFATPKQNGPSKSLSELDKLLGSSPDPFLAE